MTLTAYTILAFVIWLSIVSLIAVTIAMCVCVYELRKLVGQVRGLIRKVSSRETNLEIEDPDNAVRGTSVTINDKWDPDMEPRD